MSGYEAAKLTGISRSNAYGGLAGLVEKGAAYVIEGSANKYVAVLPVEFCGNKLRSLHKEKEYLAVPAEFIAAFREELQQTVRRDIKVVIIADGPVRVTGATVYRSAKRERQLRLIIDSAYVLTGEIDGNINDTCLYTGQRNFVNVFKEALRNEIRLITLDKERQQKGESENE